MPQVGRQGFTWTVVVLLTPPETALTSYVPGVGAPVKVNLKAPFVSLSETSSLPFTYSVTSLSAGGFFTLTAYSTGCVTQVSLAPLTLTTGGGGGGGALRVGGVLAEVLDPEVAAGLGRHEAVAHAVRGELERERVDRLLPGPEHVHERVGLLVLARRHEGEAGAGRRPAPPRSRRPRRRGRGPRGCPSRRPRSGSRPRRPSSSRCAGGPAGRRPSSAASRSGWRDCPAGSPCAAGPRR